MFSFVNISGREMQTNKTTKTPVQKSARQQINGGVAGANLVAVVTAEISAKIAAIVEEEMSMVSKKLDMISFSIRLADSDQSFLLWTPIIQ